MNIFKSDDSRKTAKEHIVQKKFKFVFRLKNNDKLNHTACLNDKKIKN